MQVDDLSPHDEHVRLAIEQEGVRLLGQLPHDDVVLGVRLLGSDYLVALAPSSEGWELYAPFAGEGQVLPRRSRGSHESGVRIEQRANRWCAVATLPDAADVVPTAQRVRSAANAHRPKTRARPGSPRWCRSAALRDGIVATADGAVAIEVSAGRLQLYNDGGRSHALGAPRDGFASSDQGGIRTLLLRLGRTVVVATAPGDEEVFGWWHQRVAAVLRPEEDLVRLSLAHDSSFEEVLRLNPSRPHGCSCASPSIPPDLFGDDADGTGADAAGPAKRGGPRSRQRSAEVGSGAWAHRIARRHGHFDASDGSVNLRVGDQGLWFNLGGGFGAWGLPPDAFGHSDGDGYVVYVHRHRGRSEIVSSAGRSDAAVKMLLDWLAEAGVERREVRVRRHRSSGGPQDAPWKGGARANVEIREDL